MFYWKHQEKRASPYKYMRRFRQVTEKIYSQITWFAIVLMTLAFTVAPLTLKDIVLLFLLVQP